MKSMSFKNLVLFVNVMFYVHCLISVFCVQVWYGINKYDGDDAVWRGLEKTVKTYSAWGSFWFATVGAFWPDTAV